MSKKNDSSPSSMDQDMNQEFVEFQTIIGTPYQEQISSLQDELTPIKQLVEEDRLLLDRIEPLFPELLERSLIHDKEHMLNILSPFLFPLIGRAAQDAVRGFANRIDVQMQRTFSLKDLHRRIIAKVRGVSYSEMILRDGLSFKVNDIFLIHYETGLLLFHVSSADQEDNDLELISGMLTAIRDFAQTTLAKDNSIGSTLDSIETSSQEILIEVEEPIYIAVVTEGLSPHDFRGKMRQALNELNRKHHEALKNYDGDASKFAYFENSLQSLMQDE